MADLGNQFDPTEIPEDERGDFEPFPAGDYLVQVVESELKDKDSGDVGLNLTIEVVDGAHQGRKLWDYLNIRHSNAQAQSISQRRLADYCLATAAGTIRDTEELHFRPFTAKVAIEKRKDTGAFVNKIKSVRPASGAAPAQKSAPAAQPKQASAPPPQQRPAGNRPWNRPAA